jgi:PKD repeat protein
MRKYLFLAISFLSFQISNGQNSQHGSCGNDLQWKELVKNHPELLIDQQKFDEGFAKFKANYKPEDFKSNGSLNKKAKKYIIPVVVHIFHANGSENISDAQVQSTIAGMNSYFAGTKDSNLVRPFFKEFIANCDIEFRLAKKDPQGNCTNGIVRKYTIQTNRGNDQIKDESAWDTKRYMNIWICKSVFSGANQVGGYAYLPFGFGPTSKNGVILVASAFNANDNTGAHEAGHWLGLYHPFQSEDSCSADNDQVDDTPPVFFRPGVVDGFLQGRGNKCSDPNFNTCNLTTPPNTTEYPDMQENVMDYFNGSCSGMMFTWQQKARMIYCLDSFRTVLISPENLIKTGVDDVTPTPCSPIAGFNTRTQNLCAGGTATFFDYSYNTSSFDSYAWEFEGGTPSTATGKNPGTITYNTEGKYNVKLTVTNSKGSNTSTLEDYITVNPATSVKSPGWRTTADWWYLNTWEKEGWYFDYEYSSNKFVGNKASFNNASSMVLPLDPFNFMNSLGNNFSLTSPTFNFTGATKPYFAFNYAFARGTTVSGTATVPTSETMLVQSSSDCGKTWITRVNIPSASISTIGDNTTTVPSSVNFVPSEASKWKEVIYNNANTFPKVGNVMFRIVFNYQGGNNFYLDNVRVGDGVASGLNNQLASELKLVVYPNPFSGNASLTYELKEKENVVIDIIDVVGKHIATLQNGTQEEGHQSVLIDKTALNLQAGIYIVQLKVGNSSISQKIIVE